MVQKRIRCSSWLIGVLAVLAVTVVFAGIGRCKTAKQVSGRGYEHQQMIEPLIGKVAERAASVLDRTVYAEIASGTSGSCTWVIDDAGVLTIKPTSGSSGQLANYISDTYLPWYNNRTEVKKVVVNPGVKANEQCKYLFYGFSNCTEMDLSNLDIGSTNQLEGAFKGCEKLTNLNSLSSWDTRNIKSLNSTFKGCSNLQNIDGIKKWDVSNVSVFVYTFEDCTSLQKAILPGWAEKSVETLTTSGTNHYSGMFRGCTNLQEVDISGMKGGCKSGESPALSLAENMFRNCEKLERLNMASFDIASALKHDSSLVNFMFMGCNSLSEITIGKSFQLNENAKLGYKNETEHNDIWDYHWTYGFPYNHHNVLLTDAQKASRQPDDSEAWTTAEFVSSYYNQVNALDFLDDGQSITWYVEKDGSDPTEIYTSIAERWKQPGEDVNKYQKRDENGNSGYWDKKNGNWFYTFFVYDKDDDWYAWEDPVPGYTISGKGTFDNPAKISKDDITVSPSATITNVHYDTERGCLRLSKKIAGIDEYTGDARFLFTVELINEIGDPVADNTIIGGHLFVGGKANILVKPGADNDVILDKIPKGYKYRILEVVPLDYEVSYERKIGDGNAEPITDEAVSGTIESSDEITVSATNTSIKEEKFVDIKISKALSENSKYETSDDAYVFSVTFENLQSQTTYKVDGGEDFTADGDGNATVTYLLQKDQELVIHDLPVNTTYAVAESGGGYTKTVTAGGDTTTTHAASDDFISEEMPAQSEFLIVKGETEIEVPVEPEVKPDPEPAPFHVLVKAVDQYGEPVSNAKMKMVTYESWASNPINYTWTSGDTAHDTGNLPAGGYTLSITSVPNKYSISTADKTIYLTVDSAGAAHFATKSKFGLEPEAETIPDNFVTFTFTNNGPAPVPQTVKKTVGTYDITLTDMDPNTNYTLNTVKNVQASKKGEVTATLTENQLLTTALPDGASYTYDRNAGTVTFTGLTANTVYVLNNEVTTTAGAASFTANEHGYASIYIDSDPLFYGDVLPEMSTYTVTSKDGSYEMKTSGPKPEGIYYLNSPLTVTTDEYGDASVNIVEDAPHLFLDNPDMTEVAVRKAADFISSYTITDANTEEGERSITKASGYSTQPNQPLSTEVEIAEEGEDITVAFTNEVRKTENIKLTKVVNFPVGYTPTEAEREQEFTIGVTFDNLDPNSAIEYSNGIIRADKNGHAERDVMISAGEILEFVNIPVTAKYSFDEPARESYKAQYTVTDRKNQNKIVSASKTADKSNKAIATATETVNEGEDITVTFTNTKVAEPEFDIKKAVTRDTYYNEIGKELTYTITVKNTGNLAGKIIIVDPVPDDVTIVDGSISNGGTYSTTGYTDPSTGEVYNGNVVVWAGPSGDGIEIASGESVNLTFKAKATANTGG